MKNPMSEFLKFYDRCNLSINIDDPVEVQATLNDATKRFVTDELREDIDHRFTDFNICVGLMSTAFAIYITYVSLMYDYDKYKTTLLCLVSLYGIFNSLSWFLDVTIYRNYILTGKNVSIKLLCNKYSEEYYFLSIFKKKNKKFKRPVFEFFNEKGLFLFKRFFMAMKSHFDFKYD